MWQVKYKVVRKVMGVLKAMTHQLEKQFQIILGKASQSISHSFSLSLSNLCYTVDHFVSN